MAYRITVKSPPALVGKAWAMVQAALSEAGLGIGVELAWQPGPWTLAIEGQPTASGRPARAQSWREALPAWWWEA